MINNINSYKQDWFINPSPDKVGYSFYAIRQSLIKAISELKNEIEGDVLDLGCGVMPYKDFLLENKRIIRYTGVDLKPTEYHNSVKPDLYWDGKNIPQDDNSLNWVIATEFFEHYFDTEFIFKEIKRVLKEGGTLFFTVPCIWPLHEVPYDEFRFTPFHIEKLAKKTGFSKVVIKPLGGYNLSMAIMLSLWYENTLLKKHKRILKPMVVPILNWLIKKDNKNFSFSNGAMPSGLYGYLTK